MTAGQRLIDQGFEQGFRQGFRQGQRAVLLRLLRLRFGDQVDDNAERRLATASPEQLDAWIDRLRSAATLAELLTG